MKPLFLPAKLPIWGVAEFKATRETLRSALGDPHYVETDSSRTMGGEEDCWYFETDNAQRVLLLLRVPYKLAVVLCSPADTEAALAAFASVIDEKSLRVISPPAVWT